jgi:hypothetical protein
VDANIILRPPGIYHEWSAPYQYTSTGGVRLTATSPGHAEAQTQEGQPARRRLRSRGSLRGGLRRASRRRAFSAVFRRRRRRGAGRFPAVFRPFFTGGRAPGGGGAAPHSCQSRGGAHGRGGEPNRGGVGARGRRGARALGDTPPSGSRPPGSLSRV